MGVTSLTVNVGVVLSAYSLACVLFAHFTQWQECEASARAAQASGREAAASAWLADLSAYRARASARRAREAVVRARASHEANGQPRGARVMPTPDYQLIDRLERELGIGQPEPKKPMRPSRAVCLIKDCDGIDTELRTWSGVLIRRIHEH